MTMSRIQKGHILAVVRYVQALSPVRGSYLPAVEFLELDGQPNRFTTSGQELIERYVSADTYDKEVDVSKTEAAQVLIDASYFPFTVCWTKIDGNDRTLRGRLKRPEPLLGRSMVEDLDVDRDKERTRLVDHRTIKYIIINGTKYNVK